MKTPEEVLTEAREIIERDGWHQGSYANHANDYGSTDEYTEALRAAPVCAMGAIHRSLSGLANTVAGDHQTYLSVQDRLQAAIGTPSITHWNDAPGRSVEDVLLAFKRAAEPS